MDIPVDVLAVDIPVDIPMDILAVDILAVDLLVECLTEDYYNHGESDSASELP